MSTIYYNCIDANGLQSKTPLEGRYSRGYLCNIDWDDIISCPFLEGQFRFDNWIFFVSPDRKKVTYWTLGALAMIDGISRTLKL